MLFKTKKSAQAHARKTHGANYAEQFDFFEEDGEWGYEPKQIPPEDSTEQHAQEEGEEVPSDSSSIMGMLLGTVPIPPVPQAEKPASKEATGLKIEKDRPEANGIKRPSAGSTCAIIWNTADRISLENGAPAQFSQVANELQGYNEFTLKTQYARWRQFNGITGRLAQPKATRLPEGWQDAIDAVRSHIPAENEEQHEKLQGVKNPLELIQFLANNFGQ